MWRLYILKTISDAPPASRGGMIISASAAATETGGGAAGTPHLLCEDDDVGASMTFGDGDDGDVSPAEIWEQQQAASISQPPPPHRPSPRLAELLEAHLNQQDQDQPSSEAEAGSTHQTAAVSSLTRRVPPPSSPTSSLLTQMPTRLADASASSSSADVPTVCFLPNTAREAYLAGFFHKFYTSPEYKTQHNWSFTPFHFHILANLSRDPTEPTAGHADGNRTPSDHQSVDLPNDVAYAINNWLPEKERCTFLVGPKDTAQSLHISPFVNVPWISHGASASPLTNKEVYPLFSRTIPVDSYPATMMAEFFQQAGWMSVLTLCTDEPYGRSVTNNFIKAYKAKGDGNEVYGGACVNPHTATKEEIQRELVPILVERRTRVLFFGGTASSEHVMTLIREVLMEAGMAEQVILFLSDQWCDGSKHSKSKKLVPPGSMCTSYGFSAKKAQGFFDRWIGSNNYYHERETTETLLDAGWPRSYLQLPEVSYNMVHDIRFSEMMLHDALLHMAAGLTRCVKLGVLRGPGGEVSQRSQKAECLAVIRNTTVTGVSGPTTMDVNGDRMGATMHVHNLNPSRVTIGCMQILPDGTQKPFFRWPGTTVLIAGRFLSHTEVLPVGRFPAMTLPPIPSKKNIIIAVCGCLFVSALLSALVMYARRFRDTHIPRNEALPFSIVFTDIQSSTAMWSRLNDAMGDALDAHHRLIRERIRIHKGYEVKTIGDSFMVVFKRASDAVAFCAFVQLALHDHVWQPSPDSEFSIFDDFYQDAQGVRFASVAATKKERATSVTSDTRDTNRDRDQDRSRPPVNHGDATLQPSIPMPQSKSQSQMQLMMYTTPQTTDHELQQQDTYGGETEYAPRTILGKAPRKASVASIGGGTGARRKSSAVFRKFDSEEAYSAAWNGIRVRMGVHHGHGRIGRDPTTGRHDFKGHAVNLAERMESLAQGGQIIVSETVLAAAKQEMAFCPSRLQSHPPAASEDSGEYGDSEEAILCTGIDIGGLNISSIGQMLDPGQQHVGLGLEIFQILPKRLSSRRFPPIDGGSSTQQSTPGGGGGVGADGGLPVSREVTPPSPRSPPPPSAITCTATEPAWQKHHRGDATSQIILSSGRPRP